MAPQWPQESGNGGTGGQIINILIRKCGEGNGSGSLSFSHMDRRGDVILDRTASHSRNLIIIMDAGLRRGQQQPIPNYAAMEAISHGPCAVRTYYLAFYKTKAEVNHTSP